MAAVHPVSFDTREATESEFWQECRRRAEILNIPAWMLAEEGFLHKETKSVLGE
jgi:hypothetical protein